VFRFLYLADRVSTLLENAIEPAKNARMRGWHVDAMARGASTCQRCGSEFWAAFEPYWSASPFDPRNYGSALRRFREFIERGEYDVIHIVSPTSALLAGFALRPIHGLIFPKVIVSATPRHANWIRRRSSQDADILVLNPEPWCAVYEKALNLPASIVGRSGEPVRTVGAFSRLQRT